MDLCRVTGYVLSAEGLPLLDATLRFSMTAIDKAQEDEALVVPHTVVAYTDETGKIDVNLWPNSKGYSGTHYIVSVITGEGSAKLYYPVFPVVVPDLPEASLIDISYLVPPESVDEAVQQVILAREARDQAEKFAKAAAADAQKTAADRLATGKDKQATAASAAAAAESQAATAADRAATKADADQTADDRRQTGVDRTSAFSSKDAAAASAAAAKRSEDQTKLDVAQTADDRRQTGEDRAATKIDADKTAADRIATADDRRQTGEDRAAIAGAMEATAADRAATAEDRAATAASAASALESKQATADDRRQTGEDRAATAASEAAAKSSEENAARDAAATAADRVVTGEDRAAIAGAKEATAADRVATAEDRAAIAGAKEATAADRAATAADREAAQQAAAATAADRAAVHDDVSVAVAAAETATAAAAATKSDAEATSADRQATAADRVASAASADSASGSASAASTSAGSAATSASEAKDHKDTLLDFYNRLAGGTKGQFLVKESEAAFDFNWLTLPIVGDMLQETYDPDGDGKVVAADRADKVDWSGVEGRPTTLDGYGIIDALSSKRGGEVGGPVTVKGIVGATSTAEAAPAVYRYYDFTMVRRVSTYWDPASQNFLLVHYNEEGDPIRSWTFNPDGRIVGVTTPTGSSDAANKQYVDAEVATRVRSDAVGVTVAPLDENKKVPQANLPALTTTGTVGAAMAGAAGKQTPTDGDFFAGVEAGGSTMFKTTFGNIKAAMKSHLEGFFLGLSGGKIKGNTDIRAGSKAAQAFPLSLGWSDTASPIWQTVLETNGDLTLAGYNGDTGAWIQSPLTLKRGGGIKVTGNIEAGAAYLGTDGNIGGSLWGTNLYNYLHASGTLLGSAAYPRRSDGAKIVFNWSGQGGQPTWIWGGNDGYNMYVYNPANWSVNYANGTWNSERLQGWDIAGIQNDAQVRANGRARKCVSWDQWNFTSHDQRMQNQTGENIYFTAKMTGTYADSVQLQISPDNGTYWTVATTVEGANNKTEFSAGCLPPGWWMRLIRGSGSYNANVILIW